MNAGGIDEIVPQSFRLAVQQLINNLPWKPELVQTTATSDGYKTSLWSI